MARRYQPEVHCIKSVSLGPYAKKVSLVSLVDKNTFGASVVVVVVVVVVVPATELLL